MTDLLYKIGITLIPNVGPVTARQLISYCGGVEEIFAMGKKELLRIPGIGERTALGILQKQFLHEAENEIRFLEQHEIHPLFFLDPDYPARLKPWNDSPILLYYKGNTDLNALRIVAVVGTRKPSPHGLASCEELLEGLQPYHITVISGLAFGIDIATHRKCLGLGIPNVGVLGHGLSQVYPPQHRQVAEKMLHNGGLLTEYLSHTAPEREHFPMRNRIIAGLCDALIVIETGRKGGSMISAEIANSYHKDVFALPGRVKDPQSQGCHLLIKTHKAALIESAEDVVLQMRWDSSPAPAAIQKQLFVELSEEEKNIVNLLDDSKPVSVDTLTFVSNKPHSELIALLLDLECKGIIRSLPGNRYLLI